MIIMQYQWESIVSEALRRKCHFDELKMTNLPPLAQCTGSAIILTDLDTNIDKNFAKWISKFLF